MFIDFTHKHIEKSVKTSSWKNLLRHIAKGLNEGVANTYSLSSRSITIKRVVDNITVYKFEIELGYQVHSKLIEFIRDNIKDEDNDDGDITKFYKLLSIPMSRDAEYNRPVSITSTSDKFTFSDLDDNNKQFHIKNDGSEVDMNSFIALDTAGGGVIVLGVNESEHQPLLRFKDRFKEVQVAYRSHFIDTLTGFVYDGIAYVLKIKPEPNPFTYDNYLGFDFDANRNRWCIIPAYDGETVKQLRQDATFNAEYRKYVIKDFLTSV